MPSGRRTDAWRSPKRVALLQDIELVSHRCVRGWRIRDGFRWRQAGIPLGFRDRESVGNYSSYALDVVGGQRGQSFGSCAVAGAAQRGDPVIEGNAEIADLAREARRKLFPDALRSIRIGAEEFVARLGDEIEDPLLFS